MNEQNMTRRKEVDLEITDFLWEIVRNWRVIAICLIIGAVLLVYKRQQECRYNSG